MEASSNPKLKLSNEPQIGDNRVVSVKSGLIKVMVKSSTHVCVPVMLGIEMPVMVPATPKFMVEVTVGVPDDEIEIGTSVAATE